MTVHESTAVAAMEAFVDASRTAADRVGTVERRFVIAGERVLMQFAGEALLQRQTEAFAHLPGWENGSPDLTVLLWDSASTGVQLPEQCSGVVSAVDAERRLNPASSVFASYQRGNSGLSLLDSGLGVAGYWSPHPALPLYDRASPLRVILNWWLARRGIQLVHAAAVGREVGMALLAAPGGRGKSTTALACLARGLVFAGDDYCGVEPGPTPRVHSLYSTAKVSPEALARLPSLSSARLMNPGAPEEGKFGLVLSDAFPRHMISDAPISAVLIPHQQSGSETRLEASTPGAALAALAPSTLLQLPPADGLGMARMRAIVESVPCFSILLGSDLCGVAETIARLVDSPERDPLP